MRAGPDDAIRFVSAAVPEYAGTHAEPGTTGLFRLDTHSRKTVAMAVLPASEQPLVLGDLEFADEDIIYLTESLVGALYRYTLSSHELQQVIAPGMLRSMQGLAMDDSGRYLYVADYVGGLFRVHLPDYTIERVTAAAGISLFGIDGLYRHGRELIAVQNGIQPQRVVALRLDDTGTGISHMRVLARNLPEFDEPTLGSIVGDDFLLVANSHWNRFDASGDLPDDLQGPVILRIDLR